MQLITKPITKKSLQKIAQQSFGNLVKAVVDVRKEILVLDADLHSDQEAYLLKHGSKQQDLWGINLYPFLDKKNFIEFDSMINLKPYQNNLTRGIDNPKIKSLINKIINKLIR